MPFSDMPDQLKVVFPDPDKVGQSEYRAIYECIADGLADTPPEEQVQMAHSMLEEFHNWAHSILSSPGMISLVRAAPSISLVDETYTDPVDSLICEASGQIWHTLVPPAFQDNDAMLGWLHGCLRRLVADMLAAMVQGDLPLENS